MTAKQLTDSILQMAIEGKLVPQDPNDEPASVLLEHIREEKRRLVKEGKLKKKDLEENAVDEPSYIVPDSWTWVRLKDITTYISRGKSPVYSEIRKYPVVAQKCNQWAGFSMEKAKFLDPKTIEKYTEERLLQNGDLLWNSTGLGTLGRMAIYDDSVNEYKWAVADSHVTVIRTRSDFAYYKYLYYYFASPEVQRVIEDKSDGSTKQKELAQETVKKYEVPFPPLAEQHRIVQKIEEILSFVKEYGKAYEEASKMDAELPDKLKKSILQEAIMGKLGTQDPNDEPASVLLEQIRDEKKKLVKEGFLKKKDLIETPVEEDEMPFAIPDSWEWVRLSELFTISSGLSYKKEDLLITDSRMVRVLRGGNISFGNWCCKPDDVFIAKKFVADELLLKEWTFITPAVSSLEHMGKTALIRKSFNDIVVGGFILMLFPYLKNRTMLEFLNFIFQSNYYRQLCQSLTNKSGQAFYNLSRTKLLNAVIPLPPLAEQQRIVEIIEAFFAEIDNTNINEVKETESKE